MSDCNFFINELQQMRENYKKKPLKDIKLSRPQWLDSQDPMSEIYVRKSELLQRGEIVYASIVQANEILFKRVPSLDCPAHIVYSSDSYFFENPEELYEIATQIYGYKGQSPDRVDDEWKEVAEVITDEYDRTDFRFSLNRDGRPVECRMIPAMVYRKLLPKKKLCGTLLPVLSVPDCKQVLILPEKYWSKEFKKAWTEGEI